MFDPAILKRRKDPGTGSHFVAFAFYRKWKNDLPAKNQLQQGEAPKNLPRSFPNRSLRGRISETRIQKEKDGRYEAKQM